jgi:hypothetical protein
MSEFVGGLAGLAAADATPSADQSSEYTSLAPVRDVRSGIALQTGLVVQELEKAARLEQEHPDSQADITRNAIATQDAQLEATRLLQPLDRLVGDSTTELVPAARPGTDVSTCRSHWLNTLAEPTVISVDASEVRTSLAARAGVLAPALDAAKSAKAGDSIQKMIAHQIAAAHVAGMEMLVKLQESPALTPADYARLTNAAARLFEISQTGSLTVQKLKTRGRQHVIVQHQQVNVGNGGRAIVAGRLGPGSRRGGRARNGQ